MLRTEAEYKAEHMSVLRDLGDVSLVPGIVKEFCVKYAPQISQPSRFVICDDYMSFAYKIDNNNNHAVNIANVLSAVHAAYFSPVMESRLSTIASDTIVSCGAIWFLQHDSYKLLDVELRFDEPAKIRGLITNHNPKGVCTLDWLPGLAFDELRTDYFNIAPVDFHSLLRDLVKHCFAFWQKAEDFIICAKPSLSLDFRYRLHHDTRKAVTFPSGDGFYALRGVRVDEKYITKPVSGKVLMQERNAEVRMVLLEKYGSKLLDDLPHKVISKEGDGSLFGFESPYTRLIEINWDGYQEIRMLHLKWKDKNGERHETLIHVPATEREFRSLGHEPPKNINDCEEMRRWVMRLNPGDTLVRET